MLQVVILSVDRSPADHVLVNTSVDLLHCPIRFEKTGLKQLGYSVYRPQILKPLILAAVDREYQRRGKVPLGGFHVTAQDLEGLPLGPDKA